MNTQIHCPKCGSTQITANKKGFSGTKAVVGGLLTGGIGLLAGTIGSNKTIITCLNCGNRFSPRQTFANLSGGGSVKIASKTEFKIARVMSTIVAVICGILTLAMLVTALYEPDAWWGVLFLLLPTFLFSYLAKRSKHAVDK